MPIYYNANPLRKMIRKAASRRIDIAGIWNSEGTYLGHGIETGLFQALWPRFACYGSTAMSFGASNNDDSAVDGVMGPNWGSGGVEYYMRSNGNGTTWTATKAERATPPTPVRDAFDVTALPANSWAPHWPMYTASSLAGWVAWQIERQTARANPIPIEEAITASFWGTEFTTGGGSMAVTVRRGEGAFTIAHNFGTVSYAGTDGTVKKSEAAIAADSGRAAWGTLQFFAQTLTGDIFATWFRMARTNQTRGFALTPFYSRSSMSIYDMYAALIALPASSWNHLFDVLTNYQGADPADHCLIFDIYEGSNFAGEASVAAGAPQPADADHPDNYVWYLQQIIVHIRGLWALSNRSEDNLVFRVRCSHPINDGPTEAEVETFRAKLRALDFTSANYRNVTVCDMKNLKSLAAMVANGDFQDATHMTYGGYTRTEKKAMNALLNTGGGRSRNRGRLLAGVR